MADDQLSADEPRGGDAALIRAFLADRDAPCPRCGYNLRMLSGDRCSECGTRVVLGIRAAEPVLRAWASATVAASLGGGFGLLFLTLVVGKAGMPPGRYLWIVFSSWAYLPIVPVLLWERRRFTRFDHRMQWAIALGLAVGVMVLMVGLAQIR